MKKVIVSGANGFVGSHVIKELIENDISVIALVRKGHVSNIPISNLITMYEFDLNNVSLLEISEKDIDVFYHFAWDGSAGNDRFDVQKQLQNVNNTIECLRYAKKIGCRKFVCAGSIMEYETFDATFMAGSKPGLGYVYGAGKLAAHAMAKAVAADIGIDFIWTQITNTYGVGEISPRLVNSTIKNCIRGISPQFTAGTQNYDFVYIDDVARAYRLIGENGRPFKDYLIGSSNAKPLREFLVEMKAAIAPELDFIFGDIPYTGVNQELEVFDCTDTERDTGFKAIISFKEGCKKTYEWLKTLMMEE